MKRMLRGAARVARDKGPLPEAMATKATAQVCEAAMSTKPGPNYPSLSLSLVSLQTLSPNPDS